MGVFYYIRLFLLKILLFLENNFIKNKSPSAMPKGWKLTSSPYWKHLELLRKMLV